MSWAKSTGRVAFIAAWSSMAIWASQADKTQNLESIVAAASEAQAKGNFPAAAEYYRQAVKNKPQNRGTVGQPWAHGRSGWKLLRGDQEF